MAKTHNLIAVAAAVLLVCASACFASQELTFSLETPELSSPPAGDTRADAAVVDAPPAPNPAPKETPKKQPPKKDSKGEVVGKVGMVQVRTAYIYVSKSASGPRYATVRLDTPLAVVREEGDWYGVLMTNKSVGWIPSKNVRLTDYNLVAKAPEKRGETPPSRGGSPSRIPSTMNELLKTATRYSGVRYVYGGTSPTRGMDCSAFVRSVFSQFGVSLPRTAAMQSQVGTAVPFDQLQPGDRLYFQCYNSYVDHCGIYAGNGYFIHCSSKRRGIGFDTLASDFFWRSLVAARRS